MSQDLAMFDPKVGLPAHIAAHFAAAGGNIESERNNVPTLSPMGKKWTVSLDGNKTTITKTNSDGDAEPVPSMKVVIVDYAKRRGRTFYEGSYDPAKESAPVCWSADGIAPDNSVPDDIKATKTSFKCETCPLSVKGSKIDDRGKQTTACSQHRMLVVVPANKLDFEPLRLKIAMTSDWDKNSPDAEAQQWFAFKNYLEFLKSRGVVRTDAVVTRMKFDSNAAYPKIFFKAERFLDPAEMAQAEPLAAQEKVQALLGATWTPAGPDGVKTGGAAPAAIPAAVAAPAPVVDPVAVMKAQLEAEFAAKMAALGAAAPAATPAPAAQLVADDDDDDDGEIVLGLGAPPAAAGNSGANVSQPVIEAVATEVKVTPVVDTPAAALANLDPDLSALLKGWADD